MGTTSQQDLLRYLDEFINENMERCREGIVCDDSLLTGLIKLKSKRKKAFPMRTPVVKISKVTVKAS